MSAPTLADLVDAALDAAEAEVHDQHALLCASLDPCYGPHPDDPDYSRCNCLALPALRIIRAHRSIVARHRPQPYPTPGNEPADLGCLSWKGKPLHHYNTCPELRDLAAAYAVDTTILNRKDEQMGENNEVANLTADVALFHTGEDGITSVLMIERKWDPFAGALALPGGHLEPGETFEHAAVRELAEETGIRIPEDSLVLVGAFADPGRDPRGRYVTQAFMEALIGELPEPMCDDDAVTATWLPLPVVTQSPGRIAFDHYNILLAAANRVSVLGHVIEI